MNQSMLESAGLTKLEIKSYIALLELGTAGPGKVSTLSGIHRRSVYDALNRLTEKGLVTKILVNNKMHYQAVNPERLREIVMEKQQNIESVLPELLLKHDMVKQRQTTLFYKGKEGIKSIFDDQLRVGKDVLIIGASSIAYDILPYYLDKYERLRAKKKIHAKLLCNQDFAEVPSPELSDIRFLPEGYDGNAAINIYGDNVAIIYWHNENPFAILIKHPDIAGSYRNYFEMMWASALDENKIAKRSTSLQKKTRFQSNDFF